MEKKSNSAPMLVAVGLLAIVVIAVFAVFFKDQMTKNDQLLAKDKELASLRKELTSKSSDISQLQEKTEKLLQRYQTIQRPALVATSGEGITTNNDREEIKSDIAKNVAADLAPLLKEIDTTQNITNEQLTRILDKLTAMLEKEAKLRNELEDKHSKALREIQKEHQLAMTLQRLKSEEQLRELRKELDASKETVSQLKVVANEIGTRYLDSLHDDSVLGNIGDGALVPVKVVKNTLTLDIFQARDKEEVKEEIRKRLATINRDYQNLSQPEPQKSRPTEPAVKTD